MKLAIIGLPQSGKSTVFNALTGSGEAPTMSGSRVEVKQAIVDVPDERLMKLAELYKSKKIVRAQISFADVAGFAEGAGGQGLSAALLNALSGMDGLLLLLRAFEDDSVPHSAGSIDPGRDLQFFIEELMLNDLITVERKLERLAEEKGKPGRDAAAMERDQTLFARVSAGLNDGVPLREQAIEEGERDSLAGLGLLTQKEILVVVNLGEGQAEIDLGEQTLQVLTLQGKLEMELAQLPPDELAEFQSEYGIEESSSQRIIRASYELMNTQSFYTVAEKEAHAWMLRKGASALEAAYTIHSDIARGFIRAEIIGGDELLELGSMAKARDAGRLRLEGKSYTIQDGDILNVRFNV